ncbi:PepSY domain-containing protein [Agrobacterium rosae]|uniref:Putative iron-regulated membrane protein n=1 Tax=Agrobacterium rosae TaxID=1972867 RepID=A0A1R3U2F3_9HYPH|nr:PepSY domain-containing protein [Agrobacterium rosae]SCX35365.1 putative iron-regulated membrane protein [Agrobacterium rosae]
MATVTNEIRRPKANTMVTKGLVVFHRWIGILLCLFFAMWFVTGAVMMYVPYPFLGDGVRIAKGAVIDAAQVLVDPAVAVDASGIAGPARLRLLSVNGQATYVLNPPKGSQVMVSASTGKVDGGITADNARAIAAFFSKTPVANVSEPMDYDQWMVHHRFDRYRPFYRVTLADESGTDLYVSQRSGEIMQRTTHFERSWNYVGAVLHWIYPTVLRQSWVAWDRTVWWLSLTGIAVTIAGIWLGIVRWRKYAKSGRGGISPYTSWMKWHHVGGLMVAGFIFTWMLSGWLSMDHGRLFSTGEMSDQQAEAYTGLTIAAAAKAVSPDEIRSLLPASDVEVAVLGGKPYLIARGGGQDPKVAEVGSGSLEVPANAFSDDAVWKAVSAAYPGLTVERPTSIPADDVYANLRSSDGIGSDGLRLVVKDENNSAVYVNPVTGRVIEVMDTSRRAYRWLYFGLHTLDFPFLKNDAIWRPLMLVLLAAGFLFSATGVVIGWKRLLRKFRRTRA